MQPPPLTGSGKFYFKSGATYEGDWMKVPIPKPEGADVKPADAKAAAAPAAEQPDASQIIRQGKGTFRFNRYKSSSNSFSSCPSPATPHVLLLHMCALPAWMSACAA